MNTKWNRRRRPQGNEELVGLCVQALIAGVLTLALKGAFMWSNWPPNAPSLQWLIAAGISVLIVWGIGELLDGVT